jgi:hypothetical protein
MRFPCGTGTIAQLYRMVVLHVGLALPCQLAPNGYLTATPAIRLALLDATPDSTDSL